MSFAVIMPTLQFYPILCSGRFVSANNASRNSAVFSAIAARLREHMALYGYEYVEVPVIEPSELFLTRAGDQIIHKLFTFERHGIPLALRPEFTSPALRRYIDQVNSVSPIPSTRWQFSGIIFEDDPADNAMQYEYMSVGAECIGLSGSITDAEIIAMAFFGCDKVGSRPTKVVLGHVQLVRTLLSAYELDARLQQFVLSHLASLMNPAQGIAYVLSLFDSFAGAIGEPLGLQAQVDAQRTFELVLDSTERGATMGGRTQADIARRLLDKQRRASHRGRLEEALRLLQLLGQIPENPDSAFQALRQFPLAGDKWLQAVDDWEQMLGMLQIYGVPEDSLVIRPIALREWEYYSGVIFELYAADGRHLAGGGRYDDFARLLGAPVDVPAVGFVYYLNALSQDYPPSSLPSYVLSVAGDGTAGVRWAALLREQGVSITYRMSDGDLFVNSEGHLRYRDTFYTLEQCSELLAILRENKHD